MVKKERIHDQSELWPGDEERTQYTPELGHLTDGEDIVLEEQHPHEIIQSEVTGHRDKHGRRCDGSV